MNAERKKWEPGMKEAYLEKGSKVKIDGHLTRDSVRATWPDGFCKMMFKGELYAEPPKPSEPSSPPSTPSTPKSESVEHQAEKAWNNWLRLTSMNPCSERAIFIDGFMAGRASLGNKEDGK